MNLGGIDGCPAGWVLAKFVEGDFDLHIYPTFKDLIAQNLNLDRILIDIPIGLSSPDFPRTIESKMRNELQNRSATVFNAPCRPAVYEHNNEKARKLNIQTENKSLSVQSLNIRNKIKEIDEFIISNNPNRILVESHPELCFKYLNGSILQSKKNKPDGIAERLFVIEQYEPNLVALYKSKLQSTKRSQAKKDDLIDAICLCLANKLADQNQLSFLEDEHKLDQKGIPIRIGYYTPIYKQE